MSWEHGTWDLSPAKARKGKPARPATKKRTAVEAVPAVEAEPEEARCGKLWGALNVARDVVDWKRDGEVTVVCEGAIAFARGKAAVRVSNELRGVVKAFCWQHGWRYVQVEPGDLKRFATGRSNAEKPAMIASACARFGYKGQSDDEADALWLLEWARANIGGAGRTLTPTRAAPATGTGHTPAATKPWPAAPGRPGTPS